MEIEIWHLVVVVVVTEIVEGFMHLIFDALRGFVSPILGRLLRRLVHQNKPQIPSVMNLFPNAKVVRLRGDHNKYLYAREDEISVTQDESGTSENVRWTVEFCSESEDKIRLKSCYGKYLTASNKCFLLGLTGRKVVQMAGCLDSSVEWQPIQEGNRVKLRTRNGNFLRANGGVAPWRDSVTHDIPWVLQDLVLWNVDVVEIVSEQSPQPGVQLESSESRSSSESNHQHQPPSFVRQENNAENAIHCSTSQNIIVPSNNKIQSVMELFRNAKTVRLRGEHMKYLSAKEDEKTVTQVTQDESGVLINACWTVEFSSESENKIRLKSCYGKYLTASNKRFPLSVTGRKVLQTASCLDSSVEWQLIEKGNRVKLRTRDGNFYGPMIAGIRLPTMFRYGSVNRIWSSGMLMWLRLCRNSRRDQIKLGVQLEQSLRPNYRTIYITHNHV